MNKILMACAAAALVGMSRAADESTGGSVLPAVLDGARTFEIRVGALPEKGRVSALVALSVPVDDTFLPTVRLNGVPATRQAIAPVANWVGIAKANTYHLPSQAKEAQVGYRFCFPRTALKEGVNRVELGPTVDSAKLIDLALEADPCEEIVIENDDFRLVVGMNAIVRSLTVKKTGEECLAPGSKLPIFAAVQDRPFNNEVKLIHPNKRTSYPATGLRREGDTLFATFAHGLYEAKVALRIGAGYVAFELVDFPIDRMSSYSYLRMDIPPVASFRVLQLSVANRRNFGDWLNASWDDRAAVGVVGTSPYPDIDHDEGDGARILYGEIFAGRKLRGAGAALIAAPGREAFLDAMDALERDFGLPRGVKSRRSPEVNEAIFHLCGEKLPQDIDKVIGWARKGGFRLMTFSYGHLLKCAPSWGLCGDYDWDTSYPNGETDARAMLAKVKAAGIKAGLHTLHSHIGLKSRYVTPVADARLNKTRRFTLAAPLSADTNVTELTVLESTADTVMFAPCRVLQFGGELISYESYTTERPYRFRGIRRGAHATRVVAHPQGEIGGILDISEFGSPGSCYVDQETDLQDEVSAKLARVYNCGFEYVYLDGSEGVNRPCNFHVSNAQYRYWKMLAPEPFLGEGAAKTHFGWHMMAGANAFDTFGPEIFKAKLREFPFAQAPITQQDMTRVDFGWWYFCLPDLNAAKPTIGTQADMWEYGAAGAAAWDCAMSILMNSKTLERHPRTDDILETMRRWGDVRRRGLFRPEWRARIRNYAQEHHLVIDANGAYDLVDYDQIPVANGLKTVRAFDFAKDGSNWIVFWHIAGSGTLNLPLAETDISLYDEFAGKPVAVRKTADGVALPVGARLYLKSARSRAELRKAFAAATLVDEKIDL